MDLHVVGKKGLSFFRYLGEPLAGSYTHFGDRPSHEDVEKLADEFMQSYAEARTDRVAVCYQRYYSGGVQRPWLQVLLPIETEPEAQTPEQKRSAGAPQAVVDYIYSPDAESILRQLLPAYFKTSLWHAFLENAVGEQRARMVAMKNATDNAGEIIEHLTRTFNRQRRARFGQGQGADQDRARRPPCRATEAIGVAS